jgi:hypothetical protein
MVRRHSYAHCGDFEELPAGVPLLVIEAGGSFG